VGISPIFNVSNLYHYRKHDTHGSEYQEKFEWEKQIPIEKNHRWRKLLIKVFTKRPGGKPIFNICSSGRETQYNMLVGKMKLIYICMEI